jgi:hypothetical protein
MTIKIIQKKFSKSSSKSNRVYTSCSIPTLLLSFVKIQQEFQQEQQGLHLLLHTHTLAVLCKNSARVPARATGFTPLAPYSHSCCPLYQERDLNPHNQRSQDFKSCVSTNSTIPAKKNPTGAGFNKWSGKRDSNPRPRPWQGRALPTELFPHIAFKRTAKIINE